MKMVNFKTRAILPLLTGLLLLVTFTVSSGATKSEVNNYIAKMNLSQDMEGTVKDSLDKAFSGGIVGEAKALTVLRLLNERTSNDGNKLAILNVLIEAINTDLPVNQLFNETAEGLARGVPITKVEQVLLQWGRALDGTKNMLKENGVEIGTPLENETEVTRTVLYVVIEDITYSIEQFVLEKRAVTNESTKELKDRVIRVLKKDCRLSETLVSLLNRKITGEELVEIASGLV